jgi:hypothetical protein
MPDGLLFIGGVAVVGIIFCLFTLSKGRPTNSSTGAPFSDDDVRRAALDIVYPLPDCADSFWGGTVEKCQACLVRIEEKRKEFAEYEPAWMRDAIMSWLDHAENRAKENLEDCQTGASRKRADEYSKKSNKDRENVRAVHNFLKSRTP